MVRDRMIAGIVGSGQTRIVSGVNTVGVVHRYRGEGPREGADQQGHEQQPDDMSKLPHAARLPQCHACNADPDGRYPRQGDRKAA